MRGVRPDCLNFPPRAQRFFEFSGARSPIFLNFLPRTARDRRKAARL
jgi:hypothetical protein